MLSAYIVVLLITEQSCEGYTRAQFTGCFLGVRHRLKVHNGVACKTHCYFWQCGYGASRHPPSTSPSAICVLQHPWLSAGIRGFPHGTLRGPAALEPWLFPRGSAGQGWLTLPVVKRRNRAAVLNLLNVPEATFLTCTALFTDHSWKPHENPLVYLSCGHPRDLSPDFKAIAGCLRLCADFSGEAPPRAL